MNNILVINGHPNKESLTTALAESYRKGALKEGHECSILHLCRLDFDLILKPDRTDNNLEPELSQAQTAIKQADHLVFIFPIWWGTYPALLKGFIDRTFLSGFAFQHHGSSNRHDKLLKGRSARLISTMDTPRWFYALAYRNMGFRAMKQGLLHYCGISPVKTTVFSPIHSSTPDQRRKWLSEVEKLGSQSR